MTPNEALEIITNAVQTDKMTVEQDKALAVVQKALKKQMPKKPCNIKTAPNHAYSTYGDCPCCNEEAFEYQHCCIYCGQALDWSEEKLFKQDEETCDFDFDEEGWE